MRNLSVIKGMYQGNGVTRRFAIPFEYNDTAQIFVTVTTYDDGDYTYRVLDRTEFTIDEDSVEIVYPKSADDTPISNSQYLTVWRDTDLLQLIDLTNQGAAWPDSIEGSLDKLHQIVQELAEGLSRALKVDIGDPQTPDQKLIAIQDYVLAAAESSRSASASEASAQRAAEAAATSEANAAESERLAGGYADTATAAASRAEDSAISARAYNAPDYDNAKTYQAGEVVTYTDGNSYKALQETTGHEPPNIIYWQKVTDYVGDNFFEIDEYGYIVPMDSPSHSRYWRIDQNGYIVPIEGGDGSYRPDTRSLSAEYLNVTNEGYVKHLRADDISAQEVDADEMTAEVAAFNTLTANAVNAQSASVTEISAGKVTADDIIAKGPVVDVRAFGAKGDGVTDDTAAIQAAIDYVGCATYTEYQNNIKGGTLYIPRGKYRITSPIYINPQMRVIGDGNKQVWGDYVTRGENAGTNIICDFENTEQYAVNIVGWVTSTGERDSALYRAGTNVYYGTVTECQNVSLENISIIANSTIALGVHCVAASFLKIDKVSILGFRNGMIVSASWPVHISESFILAYHVGLALGYDVNGGCVSNTYINKIGDMAYTVDNRIIHYSDYGEEDSLARTGIYAEYLNAVTFENVITEGWDRAYRISTSTGVCINAPYIESIRDRCFSLYGTDFVINAAKVYCPNADFMRAVESCYGCINGLGDGATYDELIESDGYCQIEFNAILTKPTQKRVNGIQLFSNHDFYVDSEDGDDDYAGTSTSPLKTIKKALSLANDGSIIYLKRGRTFTDIGQDNAIFVTKNVDIDAYGEGNNPIIQMDAANLYLYGFTVANSKISFNNINITVVDRAYNADAKSVLHLVGLADISFTNCNIDIKSGTALIQPIANHMAITNLYFGGTTTITGNGALGANVYGGLFKIIDAKDATISISADIINNGYGSNAIVISSSIV